MKRWRWVIGVIGALAAGVKLFSYFPTSVERFYSSGMYPRILSYQCILFGRVPFSMGDCLYSLLLLVFFFWIVMRIRKWKTARSFSGLWHTILFPLLSSALLFYVVFNLLWGLNYNRPGMDQLLGLDSVVIEKKDLAELMEDLVVKVNALDSSAHSSRQQLKEEQNVFRGALEAYRTLARQDRRFSIEAPSLKSSLFGSLGNYLGYTGYYNPFTGEAHVNTAVPLFLQPFISCHELGHLLGFARENEANFAGYLAASASTDPAFQYSVYLDMYLYGRAYFKRTDSLLVDSWHAKLDPLVQKDIEELKQFFLRHKNPLEAIIDRAYDAYLQANQQPEGKKTYGKVIYWLAAYRKKVGRI